MGREVRRVPANWEHPKAADENNAKLSNFVTEVCAACSFPLSVSFISTSIGSLPTILALRDNHVIMKATIKI